MDKINRSLDIIRQSLATLREHPRLMWFPLINLAGLAVFFVFFFLPLAVDVSVFSLDEDWPAFQERMEQNRLEREEWEANREQGLAGVRQTFERESPLPLSFTVIATMYLVSMFVVTFLNVAFYSEILQAFSGNPVVIRRGIAFAMTKLRAIVAWSLLAGVVGVIIRKIEENVGFIGRIIMGLIGISWSVASVFAIPVIIREKQQHNPVAYLKTSAGLIRQTWGEGLVGIIGITGVVVFMILGLSSAVIVLGAVIGSVLDSPPVAVAIFALCVPLIVLMSYVAGMVRSVYLCGLYVYATEGVVPGGYDAAVMEQAWRVRKRK